MGAHEGPDRGNSNGGPAPMAFKKMLCLLIYSDVIVWVVFPMVKKMPNITT